MPIVRQVTNISDLPLQTLINYLGHLETFLVAHCGSENLDPTWGPFDRVIVIYKMLVVML